jgi:hypothetical protein
MNLNIFIEANKRLKEIENISINWKSPSNTSNDFINAIEIFDNLCLYYLCNDPDKQSKKEKKICEALVLLYKIKYK